uniref:Uncharacterized protein n=1 Tax=Otolemur garnettii TaxID=30611 RepID=H0XNC6_OTOGA
MKSTIFFAFSLLLILEKQSTVMGFYGGTKGQLPGRSYKLLREVKDEHSFGKKGTQEAGSQKHLLIHSEEHVDNNNWKQKYNQVNWHMQYERNMLGPYQNGKQGKTKNEAKDHGTSLPVYHIDNENNNEIQNPCENQEYGLHVKLMPNQHLNAEGRPLVHVIRKKRALYGGQDWPQIKTQGSFQIQKEDDIQNADQEIHQSEYKMSTKYLGIKKIPAYSAYEAPAPQVATHKTFPIKDEDLVIVKNPYNQKLGRDPDRQQSASQLTVIKTPQLQTGKNSIQIHQPESQITTQQASEVTVIKIPQQQASQVTIVKTPQLETSKNLIQIQQPGSQVTVIETPHLETDKN